MLDAPIVVVGGGLGGMTCAAYLARGGRRVVLLERETRWGGRVHTVPIPGTPLAYEAGGARYHADHRILASLVRVFQLQAVDVPGVDVSAELVRRVCSREHPTTHSTLPRTTDILELQAQLGYSSEFIVSHAAEALRSVCTDLTRATYRILPEGMEQLVRALHGRAVQYGVTCHTEYEVQSLDLERRTLRGTRGARREPFELQWSRVVLAIPSPAIDALLPQLGLPQHLAPVPLMRIYALWDAPWWGDLPKQAKGGEIGIFIPIREGLALASYTDGEMALRWQSRSEPEQMTALVTALRKAFPHYQIAPPQRIFACFWREGVHCFVPRPHSPSVSDEALVRRWEEPLPRVHLAGEAVSLQHQWIEGAVESGARVARRILGQAPRDPYRRMSRQLRRILDRMRLDPTSPLHDRGGGEARDQKMLIQGALVQRVVVRALCALSADHNGHTCACARIA